MALPKIGETLGDRYRIDEILGEGGFGRVYRAYDVRAQRPVALKFLKPTDSDADARHRIRFKRELQAIAGLENPHTLTLFDHGSTPDGGLYMVTEYLEGDDLSALLHQRHHLTEEEVATIAIGVLQSLHEAHGRGIVHRDIKPANIRVTTRPDGKPWVKLLDFGIARSVSVDQTRLTAEGTAIGTPRYMSPEHLFGDDLSPKSDLHSLGLVLYDALLGLDARAPSAVGLQAEFPADAQVSLGMRSAVDLLMSTPGFSSAEEALHGFRTALGRPSQPIAATPAPRSGPAPAPRRPPSRPQTAASASPEPKSRSSLAIFAVICVLAAAVTAGYAWSRTNQDSPRRVVKLPRPVVASTPAEDAGVIEQRDAPAPVVSSRDRSLGCSGPRPSKNGDTIMMGLSGTIHARLPENYQHDRPHALIIDSARKWADPSPALRALADREDIVLIELKYDGFGRATHYYERLEQQLDATLEHVCIDPRRVFVVSRMAESRVILQFDAIQAAATTGYLAPRAHAAATKRISAMPHLHVAARDSVVYPHDGKIRCVNDNGPNGRPLHGSTERVTAEEHRQSWFARNGCSGPPIDVYLAEERCVTWQCDVPFVACEAEGGGRWPDMDGLPGARCVDDRSNFDYAAVIWAFFNDIVPAR